jgi:eukaryotic-like serine/threonine-protein kinase
MPDEALSPAAGTLLADRYRLIQRVGIGGMGEVWEAEDVVLERRVAVKLVADAHRHDQGALARFEREARTGARLIHPNLATVYDYGVTDEGVYLVMELLDGETLGERLRRGPLPPAEAAQVVAEAADALAAAHAAGVVHRDVKPSNLMLTPSGTKVMDFGIATGDGDPLTATGLVIGTAAYLAPERVRGEPFGPEADIYSLGAVLVEAVTGEQAFAGATPAEVAMVQLHREPPDLTSVAGVPPPVARAAQEALAKDAAQRPTAQALAALLRRSEDRAPGGTTVVAPAATATAPIPVPAAVPPAAPVPPRTGPAEPAPTGPGGWLVALGLLALLLIGAGVAYALNNDDDDGTPGSTGSTPATTAAPTVTTAPPATTVPATTAPPATTTDPPATTVPVAASGELSSAAVTYVETLDAGDFESAWALTSTAFQGAQDRESWENYWSIWDTIEVVGEPEVDEGSGTVVLTLSYDGSEEPYRLTFAQGDDGRWLVDGPVGR